MTHTLAITTGQYLDLLDQYPTIHCWLEENKIPKPLWRRGGWDDRAHVMNMDSDVPIIGGFPDAASAAAFKLRWL